MRPHNYIHTYLRAIRELPHCNIQASSILLLRLCLGLPRDNLKREEWVAA
jgi:hypothetical protein